MLKAALEPTENTAMSPDAQKDALDCIEKKARNNRGIKVSMDAEHIRAQKEAEEKVNQATGKRRAAFRSRVSGRPVKCTRYAVDKTGKTVA